MTALLHEKEFSRSTFLKGGGALIVGFSALGAGLSGKAQAGAFPIIDAGQLDSWLTIDRDGKVTVRTGRVDQGQGKHTSWAQVVAEELDVEFDAVTMILGDTAVTPNQGRSVATDGIKVGILPVRNAAAQARQTLLGLAATQLGVAASQLTVNNGVVSGSGRSVTYGELIGGKRFNVTMTVTGTAHTTNVVTAAPLKNPLTYKIVGQSIPRVDIPAKVAGTYPDAYRFTLPGMLHGRVVLPPSIGAELVRVKGFTGKKPQGVQVVVKNNFVAVVAKSEWVAIQAANELQTEWTENAALPNLTNFYDALRTTPEIAAANRSLTGNVDAVFASGSGKTLSARYDFPNTSHGMIGPSVAVASWNKSNGSLTIWSPTQYLTRTRTEVAEMLGLSEDNVRVVWREGSSSFGRLGVDDAAGCAAILSKEIGQPVRVQWMRQDEHGWAPPYRAITQDLRATVDSSGRITAWRNESWTAYSKSDQDNMLPSILLGTAKPGIPGTGSLSQPTPYEIPNVQLTGHLVQPLIRNLYMRAVGSIQNRFIIEGFMDELAAAAGVDPIDFRLKHMTNPRTIGVLQAVKELSRWQSRVSPLKAADGDVMRGRGVALYPFGYDAADVAMVAEVEVSRKTGTVRVAKAWVAVDLGKVIHPNATISQAEGGMMMGISRALKEEVRFKRNRVSSVDWVTYPIARFNDAPDSIEVKLVDSRGGTAIPDGGIGEPGAVLQPAAIGNAIFDATGVRIRRVPFTPATVRAALKAAGVS